MTRTFNTCADIKVSYQKTKLDCNSNFIASVDIGRGQVLMRVSLVSTLDFKPPADTEEASPWAVILTHGDTRLKTFLLKGLDRQKTVAVENILADKDMHISAKLTRVDKSQAEVATGNDLLKKHFGSLAPLAVIFEVC